MTKQKLKVFEMFAGYGGASFALKMAGIEHEVVGFSEIDKFADQCWKQNHGDNIKNWGDCTRINPHELPDFDLLTGGFPCQSFSVAGKGLGTDDDRGLLFNDIIRIAEVKRPKYMLLENVKGLLSKKHSEFFEFTKSELTRLGYKFDVRVYKSSDYGIPQSRERVFYVCMLEELNYEVPIKRELNIFLKDILEEDVEEKYYLKENTVNKLKMPDTSYCIDANYHKGTNLEGYLKKKRRQIIQLNKPIHSNDRIYGTQDISPTLNTMQGGNRQPFIVASRGRNVKTPSNRTTGISTEQRLEPKFDGTTNTITSVQKDNFLFDNYRIRKLTPTECFRLMGFLNDEINLEGLSNTQRYKLAGNGWDVNLVKQIFEAWLK